MTWYCLQHVAHEGPGHLATALSARGVELRTARLSLGDVVPKPADVDGLVVMGGPMGANDDLMHDYLRDERALIAECVLGGVPVIGVCLGAQLIAAALGARVYRGERGEVGAGTVDLTDDGRQDPVFGGGPDPLPVVHWHHDTFDLPDGAVSLASSERYAHQAFRVGDRVYGVQFHVELGPDDLPMLRQQMNPARVPSESQIAAVAESGRPLVERLADAVTGA